MSADTVSPDAARLSDGQYRYTERKGWECLSPNPKPNSRAQWVTSYVLAPYTEEEGLKIIGECPWSPTVVES